MNNQRIDAGIDGQTDEPTDGHNLSQSCVVASEKTRGSMVKSVVVSTRMLHRIMISMMTTKTTTTTFEKWEKRWVNSERVPLCLASYNSISTQFESFRRLKQIHNGRLICGIPTQHNLWLMGWVGFLLFELMTYYWLRQFLLSSSYQCLFIGGWVVPRITGEVTWFILMQTETTLLRLLNWQQLATRSPLNNN